MLIDSHCHLIYLDDIDSCLEAARDAGVAGFLCIGVKADEHTKVLGVAERHADVWATAGIHPDGVDAADSMAWIERAADRREVVGIGETGLDYYRLDEGDDDRRKWQRTRFAEHLAVAESRGLPVIVHTRSAPMDTLDVMRSTSAIGVMHCFTESWDVAKAALDLGYYVSISGIVTFKNADIVRDVARRVPPDRLLIETDSPWLAPVPVRGKRNEPKYVAHTAAFVASLRGESVDSLAASTTENFFRLFGRAHRSRENSSSINR